MTAPQQPVLVVMGVSGSGKSTVAGVLAGRLGWDLGEGDDLHPPENVAKMAAGQPLTDEDRWPWLRRVAGWITEHTEDGRPGIITCSALKRRYRDVLRGEHVRFVYLAGTREDIGARLRARHGHYMPATLLDSQCDALEPPAEDEEALWVDITPPPADQVDFIISRLGLTAEPSQRSHHQEA